MQLAEHPTVKLFEQKAASQPVRPRRKTLDAAWLSEICREAGADDVGFVEIERAEISDQKDDIIRLLSAHQDADQLCLSHESGTHPEHGPLGGEPGISPQRRPRKRGFRPHRFGSGEEGSSGHQPVHGISHGNGPFPRKNLGRRA